MANKPHLLSDHVYHRRDVFCLSLEGVLGAVAAPSPAPLLNGVHGEVGLEVGGAPAPMRSPNPSCRGPARWGRRLRPHWPPLSCRPSRKPSRCASEHLRLRSSCFSREEGLRSPGRPTRPVPRLSGRHRSPIQLPASRPGARRRARHGTREGVAGACYQMHHFGTERIS